jgi:hypothetical protein
MNNTTEAHDMAKKWATDLLRKLPARTEDVIRSKAQLAIQFVEQAMRAGSVDEEQLVSELLHAFSITVSPLLLVYLSLTFHFFFAKSSFIAPHISGHDSVSWKTIYFLALSA